MKATDKICYCYDVVLHKLWYFARRRKPRRASQMSECLGAGTGCGWCIPSLKRIHEEAAKSETPADTPPPDSLIALAPEEYAAKRRTYIDHKEPRNEF